MISLALQQVWASGVDLLDPQPEEAIVVSASRMAQRAFDAPAAVSLIDAEALRDAGPRVNLSEALNRVPGISVLNRQNYAQDLQLSIRGFGARSTFGIRGVRLIVDGIPATMPDGQGQASTIDLSSAKRIEVLRGPLALLYGNAAGGVVLVESEVGAAQPTVGVRESLGAWGTQKRDVQFAAGEGEHRVLINASRFETDGYRQHSAARRDQLNARWRWQVAAPTRLDVTLNMLDQPDSQDPQGLTRAQWQADPRQAIAAALTQDTRKTVRQQQLGAVLSHQLDDATTLSTRVYLGARSLDNALATPLAAQQVATASGGMVVFQRRYQGLGLQLDRRQSMGEGLAMRWTAGVDFDRMTEDRQGYLNLAGQRGALKRDEDNLVYNADVFLQVALDIGPAWTATAGVRSSRVRFESDDHYLRPGNPDDSGALSYRASNPVLGLGWHVAKTVNLYTNVGKGFETPTFTELAYRNGASGLNTDLRAARSRHAEIGAKWRSADRTQQLDLAVFGIRTTDEIVADSNDGGRTTYKNAPRTRRHGVELSWQGQLSQDWRAYASLATLSALFSTPFSSGSPATVLPAGKRLPGVPDKTAFAELAYAPKAAWGGFEAAVALSHQGHIQVNDANDDQAPAVTLVNLRVGFAQAVGGWELRQGLRLNNATDRRYAGSVIVNEANRRYFEPALPRNAMVTLSALYRFQ
ncbi:TonB-dependent receptor [Chitinimonas naiadis]